MAKKKTAATSQDQKDAYYRAMRDSKVAAGLSFEQATEVTERQRATDEALGVELEIETPDANQEPDTNSP